jgi:hypothetical protein
VFIPSNGSGNAMNRALRDRVETTDRVARTASDGWTGRPRNSIAE